MAAVATVAVVIKLRRFLNQKAAKRNPERHPGDAVTGCFCAETAKSALGGIRASIQIRSRSSPDAASENLIPQLFGPRRAHALSCHPRSQSHLRLP
jgi:hypothetical protein